MFKIKPWFDDMIKYFWETREYQLDILMNGSWDYPDYGGLPKEIAYKLESDQVDWIQENLYDCLKGKRKHSTFAESVLYRGFRVPVVFVTKKGSTNEVR
jgi:hypothetical protein